MDLNDLELFPEEQGDYGIYIHNSVRSESNTSKLHYAWGYDRQQIRTQFVDPGIRELIREIKKRGKTPSQDEAIKIAYSGIEKHSALFTVFGTEMHNAFEAFVTNKPVILPTPKHEEYFLGFLYFWRRHQIKPILIEGKLTCPCCGITTQIDLYAEVDGFKTVLDYKTGRTVGFKTPFQLRINKHVLENCGYTVEQTWAVHVQDFIGYPIPFDMPWEKVKLVLDNADLKIQTLRPKVYARKHAGIAEADASSSLRSEKKEAANATSEEQLVAQDSDVQGRPRSREEWETLPIGEPLTIEELDRQIDICLGQADTQPLETAGKESLTARKRGRPRKVKLTEIRADETSSPQTATPPEDPGAGPDLRIPALSAKHRKPLAIYADR